MRSKYLSENGMLLKDLTNYHIYLPVNCHVNKTYMYMKESSVVL